LIGSIGIGTAAYITNDLAHTLLRSAPQNTVPFSWSHYNTLSGRKQPQRYKFYVNSIFTLSLIHTPRDFLKKIFQKVCYSPSKILLYR
jgi:hypothetical protein